MKWMKFVVLLIAALPLMGARQMLKGFPIGTVTAVDKSAGTVSIDLGEKDGVISGMPFVIISESGHEAARVTAGDVYPDIFWSEKVAPEKLYDISPGMQARWLLTPEIIALDRARKDDSGEAFKKFYRAFPKSRFMASLIREMPEEKLKKVSPVYYSAFKAYTKESFKEIIKNYPGTGFAQAAEMEIKSIENYDKEQEKIRAERVKRAEEAEAERKRQEAVEEKIREQQEKAQKKEYLGRLRNNSASAVRFVFKAPSDLPQTVVPPNSYIDARSQSGSFQYDVYKGDDQVPPAGQPGLADQLGQADFMSDNLNGPGQSSGPQPLKSGTVDIEFDFWEADYP